MARVNSKKLLQPLTAFTMAMILGLYVKYAINESRRQSETRKKIKVHDNEQNQK